jgi:hypothetical protein
LIATSIDFFEPNYVGNLPEADADNRSSNPSGRQIESWLFASQRICRLEEDSPLPRDGAQLVVFEFKIQRRDPSTLDLAKDIENVCTEWPEDKYPFVEVATITIAPQRFNSPESQAACENLTFSPWQGLAEHRPLGGINRMRKAVYEESTRFRHLPKEPAASSKGN